MNDLAHLTCAKSFLKVENIDCFENENVSFSFMFGGCKI